MEYVSETKEYTVTEFHDQFKDNLPQLVKVVQGYCGEIAEDVFDSDQVLLIEAVSRQRRVIAKYTVAAHSERLFSIPANYFEKLCVVKDDRAGNEKFLHEILRDSRLPLIARFSKDRTISICNTTVNSNTIPDIEMLQTFDEVNLLGNFINNCKMSTEVIHVPLHLSQLRLSIITGIKRQSASQWKRFQEELERSSSYIEYDLESGNSNIAEYEPSAIHSGKFQSKRKVILFKGTPHKDYDPTERHNNVLRVVSQKARHILGTFNQHEAHALPRTVTRVNASEIQGNVSHTVSNHVSMTLPTKHCKRPSTQDQHPPVETALQAASQVVVSKSVPKVSNREDVSKLTIDEVVAYLNKLGLGQYEDKFREQRVDGKLLVELDKDILKDDFGMKGIEVLRLTQFAKDGHVAE